jgi:hypothetical protein
MSTYATDIFDGNGSTSEFDLTFPFINRNHVQVIRRNQSNGFETTLTVIETGTPVGDEFRWENDTRIKVGTAPTSVQQLQIQRDTPENQQLVPWADGSYLISEDLNTSDLQFLYGLQELEDKFGLLETTAIKYLGAIDLTVNAAPASPSGGDFYINTGTGTVVSGWTGIAGNAVVGSEQIIYNAPLLQWQIFAVPSSQVGVVEVQGTAPIAVNSADTQRPVVSVTAATTSAAGSMSAADKTKLDGVAAGAEVNVNADWSAASGDAQILNKPTIPAAQVNSDWSSTTGVSEILNKPTIPASQVNSDWTSTTGVSEILNKPTIPSAQVNSDWSSTTGVSEILNKPTIPAAQVNSDWTSAAGVSQILNKPTIPAAQVNTDWNSTSGVTEILNKPTIPAAYTDASVDTHLNTSTASTNEVLSWTGTDYDWVVQSGGGGGGGAQGGGPDHWAYEHDNVITTSYTISTGKNVITAGPIEVQSGATVTLPSGSTWVIA